MVAKVKYRSRGRKRGGRFILSLFAFIASIVVSYFLYFCIYQYAHDKYSFPVSRIVIEGTEEFKYITKAEIANVVGRLVGGQNLLSIDLGPVHNTLVQMPWVNKASVAKRFPDTLVVKLEEHYPSARWKNNGIYDALADEVFYPDMKRFARPLVILSAPHDTLAKELFEHAVKFLELTKGSPYMIEEVQLDASRSYRIRLQENVWLILGRESVPGLPEIRLRRFLHAFPSTKLKLSEIDYVDLRYDNGFAIGDKHKIDPVTVQ